MTCSESMRVVAILRQLSGRISPPFDDPTVTLDRSSIASSALGWALDRNVSKQEYRGLLAASKGRIR
jgi:hypothetical protein